jgi:tetratricopeptide (TPR) repeat protein
VSWSPDGETLATGGDDGSVKLWGRTGEPIKTIDAQQSSVWSVSWSPDGETLATGGYDGSVKLWPNEDLDRLLARGCDWLKSYLIVTPEDLQKLTVCQTPELRRLAAPALVAEGKAQAAAGRVEAAITALQTAQQWDPSLSFDAVALANQLAEANQLLEQANQLMTDNQPVLALTRLREALALVPDLDVRDLANTWNSICRAGSLNNQAAQVLDACEQAVRLAPNHSNIRDSRGLARALTGDIPGAIEDFQAFVDGLPSDDALAQQRQRWINELKAGRNPFTPEELESLRNE